MINPKTVIEEVKKRLIKLYNPVEIYIFGSYAWGNPDNESDLDLVVVVDELDKNRYKAMEEGHRVLVDLMVPKDILLYTKTEFDEDTKNIVTLLYKVKRDGKLIYARS